MRARLSFPFVGTWIPALGSWDTCRAQGGQARGSVSAEACGIVRRGASDWPLFFPYETGALMPSLSASQANSRIQSCTKGGRGLGLQRPSRGPARAFTPGIPSGAGGAGRVPLRRHRLCLPVTMPLPVRPFAPTEVRAAAGPYRWAHQGLGGLWGELSSHPGSLPPDNVHHRRCH